MTGLAGYPVRMLVQNKQHRNGYCTHPSLSRGGVGYRGVVIGDVELRPLAPIILGRRGRDLQQLAGWVLGSSSGRWDVAFLGGGILGGHESDTSWHGMLRWKARSRPVPEATLRDFFFCGAFFPTAPAPPAETSQAIAGFLNSAARLLIITRLASSLLSSDPASRHFCILKPNTRQPRVEDRKR